MTSNESPNFPSLLKHIYPTEKPNQKIILHQGDLEIKQEFEQTPIIARGSGDIYLKWFPYPQVEFNLSGDNLLTLRPDIYEVFVRLPNTENFVQAIAPISSRTKEIQEGKVREPLVIGSGQGLKYVQFYLSNLERFSEVRVGSRATFVAEGWEVIIHPVKDIESHLNLLKAQGGYAITHVARAARLKQSALELIAWFHLVEKEEVFTAKEFKHYSASKKINRLLEKLKIPKSIDSRLNAIAQYSNEFDEEFKNNGAYALQEVRNDMAHLSTSNRQRLFNTPSLVLTEAARLIRWYLELSFLSLSNYQGFYCNCLPQPVSFGSREFVPWSSYNSPDQNTDRVGS